MLTAHDTTRATVLPSDPLETERLTGGVAERNFHGERLPMLLRWRDVRRAAGDPIRFDSSQPGRIPTPPETGIRSFRQIPIETNPPDHTAWKDLLHPYFRRPRQPGPKAEIERLVREGITRAMTGETDMISDFALPVQSAALAVLLDTDRTVADEWIGWGLHAFRTHGATDEAKAQRFLDFIDRMLDHARAAPDGSLFAYLHTVSFRGRELTRDEKRGICHLALSGGRDTVINAMTGVLAHFAGTPTDLELLRADPRLIEPAAEEFFRILSPLPMIGRVCPAGFHASGTDVAADARVGLCWASANRDAKVFADPHAIRLDRKPNPHVAFGAGPHTCLGAPLARLLVRSLLSDLARRVARVETVRAEPRETQFGTPYLFHSLHMRLTPLADSAARIGDTS